MDGDSASGCEVLSNLLIADCLDENVSISICGDVCTLDFLNITLYFTAITTTPTTVTPVTPIAIITITSTRAIGSPKSSIECDDFPESAIEYNGSPK